MRRRRSKSGRSSDDPHPFYDDSLLQLFNVEMTEERDREEDASRDAYVSALIDVKVAEIVQKRVQALSLQQCSRIHHSYDALVASVRHAFESRSRELRKNISDLHVAPPAGIALEGMQWRYQDAVDTQRSLEIVLEGLKRLRTRSQQILLSRNMNAKLFLELADAQEKELAAICDLFDHVKNRAAPFHQLCNSAGEAMITFSDSRSVSALEKFNELIQSFQRGIPVASDADDSDKVVENSVAGDVPVRTYSSRKKLTSSEKHKSRQKPGSQKPVRKKGRQ